MHIKPAITRFGLAALLWNVPILADTISSSALHQFVGYTLIDILTITGWRDKDGTGDDGAFKGCKYGRVIIFEGNKALKCSGYGYQYAYRPEAVIFSNGGTYKMLVENEIYDMQSF